MITELFDDKAHYKEIHRDVHWYGCQFGIPFRYTEASAEDFYDDKADDPAGDVACGEGEEALPGHLLFVGERHVHDVGGDDRQHIGDDARGADFCTDAEQAFVQQQSDHGVDGTDDAEREELFIEELLFETVHFLPFLRGIFTVIAFFTTVMSLMVEDPPSSPSSVQGISSSQMKRMWSVLNIRMLS